MTEAEILAAAISPDEGNLSPLVARFLLDWRFPATILARISQLAVRESRNIITPAESEELNWFLQMGRLLNILQAKARASLGKETDRE